MISKNIIFVNFKLGFPKPLFAKVSHTWFWPLSVKVSRFAHRPKAANDDSAINLEAAIRSPIKQVFDNSSLIAKKPQ